MELAVFGDTGGHLSALVRSLHSLGVRFDPIFIPENLTIVHVGDLIHKGPHSDEIVLLVDEILNSPYGSQWVQLFGNHEMQHVQSGINFWRCKCLPETVARIQSWWSEEKAHVAAGFNGGDHKLLPKVGSTVVTHAGVSYPFALFTIGAVEPGAIIRNLNLMQKNDDPRLNTAGVMLSEQLNPAAGSIWASSAGEVYPTWVNEPKIPGVALGRFAVDGTPLFSGGMPFNQIHGHTAPFAWEWRQWYPSVSQYFRDNMNVYPKIRVSRFSPGIDSGAFLAVDPGFEKKEPLTLNQPFLLIEEVAEVFTS